MPSRPRAPRSWWTFAALVCAGGLLALTVTLVDPATSRAATPDPVMAGAWPIPGVTEAPAPLVAGSDGDEWFVVDNSSDEFQLEQITPTGSISAPGAQFGSDETVDAVTAMVVDGGSVWATVQQSTNDDTPPGLLDHVSSDGTQITNSFPTASDESTSRDTGATVGPDGDIYVAAPNGNVNINGTIDQFTTAGAERTFSTMPGKDAQGDSPEPESIAALGSTLFFSNDHTGDLESVTTDDTDATVYSTSTNGISAGTAPGSMVAGPDGDLWTIADSASPALEQISPSGALLKTYSTGFAAKTQSLASLAVGADGELWFPENGANEIGALNPSTGVITSYPLPAGFVAEDDSQIAAGANGTIWFTAFASSEWAVGEISGLTGAPPPTAPTAPAPASPDPTATNVSCAASNVADGAGTECTATVTDTASTGYTPPTGTVTFATSPYAASFDPASCTLSSTDAGTAACSATFVPANHENYTLTASYGGDSTHQASTGQSATITTFVTPAPPVAVSTGGGTSPPGVGYEAAISVSVRPADVASVQVSCTGSVTCNLTLTATVVEKLQGGKLIAITALTHPGQKRKKTVLKTVVVGSTTATIAAGKRTTVTLRLNATGRRLVARHRLRTKLTISQKGSKTTHTASFTFTAPKPAKHKHV